MPGLYRDEGVVLKAIKLGEADRILTIYTRQNGKVRAVAKGVRKTKSRFGGRLEPLTQVDLLIYRGRNLDTITGADVISSFKELRTDYDRLTSAGALVDLVEKITPDREKAYPVYSLLLAGLNALGTQRSETIVPAFLVKLLSISGYHPQLTVCAGCGSNDTLQGFSPGIGGVVCELCWHDDPDAFRMEPEHLALITHLLASDFGVGASPEMVLYVTQALRRYAEYHLERPLRSLNLLAG